MRADALERMHCPKLCLSWRHCSLAHSLAFLISKHWIGGAQQVVVADDDHRDDDLHVPYSFVVILG